MQFRVLGPVEVESGDGRVLALTRRQERCLLAILLLDAGRTVSTDRLSELLWETNPPEQPRRAVQAHVAHIRAILAQEPDVTLLSSGDGYLLQVPADAVDASRFRRLVGAAAATDDLAGRDRLLRDALALWRGTPMQNAASDALRRRLCAELEELHLHAIEESLATGLALGRHRELIPELARRSAEHPTRERLVELHMLALHHTGRAADALNVYANTRARLAEQLGLDPGPALQRLHRAILRREPVVLPAGLVPAAASAAAGRARPAQLPPDPAGFIGREEHLAQLDAVRPGAGTAVVISAIAGTAGVGKTALAVHWAHANAARFPDGQLYVNLRGFDPGGSAMAPADAVRGFLDALDVPADRIPADFDAQVGLYRSLLADKQLLVVLDNARDAEQVRPVLPGAPGCLAVVTSRNQLSGLIAVEGALPITLDLLTPSEARRLLERRLGTGRLAAEPAAVDEIIARCVRLPLALAIASARAATRPRFPLAVLADELRQARSGLDALDGGDATTDVRAVFSWSYRALGNGAARLFRLLGLHPGPDISVPAAASLAGIPVYQARALLAELARAHLIAEHVPGRYTFHDLLRAYATELAHELDTEAERRAALHRMFDHYLHTAYAATLLLSPQRQQITLDQAQSGVTAETPTDRETAAAWFGAEHRTLLAAVMQAASTASETRPWQLAWALTDFLLGSGQWQDALGVFGAAFEAANGRTDIQGQANAHSCLGITYYRLGRHNDARVHFEHALKLYSELGDHLAQGRSHLNLSALCSAAGDRPGALSHAEQALVLFDADTYKIWRARALNTVGWAHARLGSYDHALTFSQQALGLLQEVGDAPGEADAWDSLGYIHHQLGHHQQATTCYHRACKLWGQIGDRYYEASVYVRLGHNHHAADETGEARDAWQEALAILDELHHPDAEQVRGKLQALTPTR